MQIKLFTDYAIRMVMYIATHDGVIPSCELAENLNIPQSIILKIGNKLKHSGIIRPVVGAQGGLTLNKRPEDIALMDIISQFEATMKISKCLEDKHADRYAEVDNPMKKFYGSFQGMIEEMFMATTIQHLLEA